MWTEWKNIALSGKNKLQKNIIKYYPIYLYNHKSKLYITLCTNLYMCIHAKTSVKHTYTHLTSINGARNRLKGRDASVKFLCPLLWEFYNSILHPIGITKEITKTISSSKLDSENINTRSTTEANPPPNSKCLFTRSISDITNRLLIVYETQPFIFKFRTTTKKKKKNTHFGQPPIMPWLGFENHLHDCVT